MTETVAPSLLVVLRFSKQVLGISASEARIA